MEHEFAITSRAVERYLMGDMPAEERDAFEQHYFVCDTCAADLRVTARFVESAKAVWREGSEPPIRLSMMDWLRVKWLSPGLVAVAAAAIAVIAFQNAVVIPALKSPRALTPLTLDLTSRASVQQMNPHDPLYFYVAPERPVDSNLVWAELSSPAGKVLRSGSVAAPKAHQPIDVYFPGTLKPGRYIITIRSFRSGHPEETVAQSAFEVNEEEHN